MNVQTITAELRCHIIASPSVLRAVLCLQLEWMEQSYSEVVWMRHQQLGFTPLCQSPWWVFSGLSRRKRSRKGSDIRE